MEMTFPHATRRPDALDRRCDHDAIVAIIVARQAESRTAKAMLMAEIATATPAEPSDDVVEQRIHYFGSQIVDGEAPSGSFFDVSQAAPATKNKSELIVYQNNSVNIKALGLPIVWTGEQANLAGHRASRTK